MRSSTFLKRLSHAFYYFSAMFYQFNTNTMEDPTSHINAVSSGLYAVFATMGAMPIIRSTKGHMAAEISKNLDKKLRDSLRDARANMFTDSGLGFNRPLLIMLDRNVDLGAPLKHGLTYQGMCHDVLDLNLNYINVEEEIGGGNENQPKRFRTKTIDCTRDEFWNEYRQKNFFDVASAINSKVKTWQDEMDKIKSMKDAMGLGENAGESTGAINVEESNQLLGQAVASIPEKMKQKESLDSNMAIVMSIVNQVQSRELDKLYELEENLNIKEQTPLQVLTNDKGTQSDKIRYLLFLILRDVIKLNEIEKYKEELEKQNCPFLKAIDYVKKIKSMSNAQSNQNESSQAGQMIGSFMNMGISLAQNVVGATKKLPVTRLVDQIIDNKDTQGIEVDYLDPKMSSVNTMARSKTMPTGQRKIM